jgi:hypothetical protein
VSWQKSPLPLFSKEGFEAHEKIPPLKKRGIKGDLIVARYIIKLLK